MTTRPASASEQTKKAAEIAGDAPLLHPNLTVALLAAINELGVIGKTRTADAGSYSYDYAPLEAVLSEVKTVLDKHGLATRTPVHGHGDGLAVTVKFLHTSGETMQDDPLPFPRGANAQATGSAITYFRRYALLASLNIATGEDDDGARAINVQRPSVMSLDDAKAFVLKLCDGNRDLAKPAWVALFDTPWTEEALTAAFDVWVHLPRDEEVPVDA